MSAVTPEAEKRGADLIERYGNVSYETDQAEVLKVMKLAGRSDTGLEDWAISCRYESVDAYYGYVPGEWQHCGHLVIGPVFGPDGGVYGLMIPERRDGISEGEVILRFRGQSHPADTAVVAGMLGRDDLDLGAASGRCYDSREAFDMFAAANRKHRGHETLGPVTGDDGKIYGLILLKVPEVPELHHVGTDRTTGDAVVAAYALDSAYPLVRLPLPPDCEPRCSCVYADDAEPADL